MTSFIRLAIAVLALFWPVAAAARQDAPPAATPEAVSQPTTWSGSIALPGGIKLDFSVDLSSDKGTISIPMQGVRDLALDDVAVSETQLRFVLKPAGAPPMAYAHFDLKVEPDGTAAGTLKQAGQEFPVTARRLAEGEKPASMNRPQEPKAPFPYAIEDVEFQNAEAGVTLAGTLVVPQTQGPHPAAVLVTGSGPQDRDESLLGHRPFLVLADHLVRHGIAVLRYDDRGVGKSTGSFATATSDDFAGDALAAVRFLMTRPEIDAKKIGIVGHSEGGLIAPICASRSSDVAYIVLLAGTGVPGAEIIALQGKLIAIANGAPADQAEQGAAMSAEVFRMIADGTPDDQVAARVREIAEQQFNAAPAAQDLGEEERTAKIDELVTQNMAQLTSPWFRRFLVMDPRENLRKVTCPVLAINGSLDLQVPPSQNLPEIEKAVKAGGNTDVTTRELPGLNHLFQRATTGSPTEYAQIEETFAPEALTLITEWITEKTR
ncbi:MAG: lipoprotein [Phycisphaerae bacterium]